MSELRAVLDTCVLVPKYLRDFLLRFALAEPMEWTYQPFWSSEIEIEFRRTLTNKNPPLTHQVIERILGLMNKQFPSASVDHQTFLPAAHQLVLPDPDDYHVVAAALAAKARAIVTFNHRDFPKDQMTKLNLEILSPHDLVERVAKKFPNAVENTLNQMADGYQSPPLSANEIKAVLKKVNLDLP